MCPVSLFIKVFGMISSCSFILQQKAALPFFVNLCSLYLSSIVADFYISLLTKMICLREMCVWPWTQTEWIILLAVSEHLHVDSLFSFVFNQQKRLPFRPYMWKAKLKSPFSCGFSDKVVSDGSSFILP